MNLEAANPATLFADMRICKHELNPLPIESSSLRQQTQHDSSKK